MGGVKSFVDIDLENNIAAVVDDFTLDKMGNPILLAEDKKYFNSGMMYIDSVSYTHLTLPTNSRV